MADDTQDQSQKTEEPTPKRLQESQEKGQVATSKEVNHWFILLGAAILIGLLAPGIMGDLQQFLTHFIARPEDLRLEDGGAGILLGRAIRAVAMIMLLPLAILVVLAALSSLIQHPPVFSFEPVTPKLEKISVFKGFKRLFSSRSLMEFVKGLLKLTIVGVVATLVVMGDYRSLIQLPLLPVGEVLLLVGRIAATMIVAVLAVMTVIAALDFLYQNSQHIKQLRMSPKEIRDEFKQTEGDPMVKARLRQIRTERARRRMMQAVPEATLVVTNPTHFAVALKYEQDEMEAPVVVAKGADLLAQRIRERATELEIPLVENPPLARALYAGVEIGRPIPPEHYRAVAEVIGYVMRLKPRRKRH